MASRVDRLKDEFFNAHNYWSLERAELVTEAYKANMAEVPAVQQALAFANVLDKKKIFIRDGELVVGNYAESLGAYEMYPEYTFQDVVIRYIHFDFDRELDESDFETDAEKKKFREIREFWRGRCMHEIADKAIPQEIQTYRDTREICGNPYGRDEGQGHIVVEYDQVVKHGLRWFIEKAKKAMDEAYGFDAKSWHFNKAVIIVMEAVIRFAHRFADLAEKMAETEKDEQRKHELLMIAKNCRNVPENPATTYWEAAQATWFIHLLMHIEQNGFAISIGRYDQYCWDVYKHDMETGEITRDFAREITESFFMKCMEITLGGVKISLTQTVTICGSDMDGNDLTNDLSYLLIEADRNTKMVQPSLMIRWHRNIDPKLIDTFLDTVWKGDASMAMINEEKYIEGLVDHGVKREDAYEYCQAGCNETVIGGKLLGGGVARPIFMIRVLELIMNGGVMPDNGKQMGPKVPKLGEYKSFDEFLEAFRKTERYLAKYVAAGIGIMDQLHVDLRPLPFASGLMHGCIERGRSLMDELDYFIPCLGHSDFIPTVNCMAAIKKCVFEDKSVTQEELAAALAADFKGHEETRMKLWNAPKFGNDDEYCDSLIPLLEEYSREAMAGYPASRKSSIKEAKWSFELIPRISHVYEGLLTPATPDGRFSKLALAAGNAAYPGTEREGLTSLINSMSKLDAAHWCGGIIGQARVTDPMLRIPEEREKVAAILDVYFKRGGSHIQLNCVSAETLKDAKENPADYRDLMVRVGGYVDYFTNLDEASQADIIRRTEMEQ